MSSITTNPQITNPKITVIPGRPGAYYSAGLDWGVPKYNSLVAQRNRCAALRNRCAALRNRCAALRAFFLKYSLTRSLLSNGVTCLRLTEHDRKTHYRIQIERLRRRNPRKTNGFMTIDISYDLLQLDDRSLGFLMRNAMLEKILETYFHREAKYQRKRP